MSQPHSLSTSPRRSPVALRLAAWLAGLGLVAAFFAWFAFVNSDRATVAHSQSYQLVSESGTTEGAWHWVGADGTVLESLGPNSAIVPGDTVAYLTHDGTRTAATFTLPREHGNETQGQRHVITIDATDAVYRLEPTEPVATVDFERDGSWMLLGGGAVLLLAGSGVTLGIHLASKPS